MSTTVLRSPGGAGLVAALTFGSIGSGLFMPLSLVFFTALTDIPLVVVAAILTAASLVSLPVPVIAGSLADRFGARRFVIAAQLMQALAFAWFTIARDPVSVLGACILMAVGSRAFWATVFTAIADQSRANGNARGDEWFAAANIARTAGITIGGVVTGAALAAASTQVYVSIAVGSAACMAIAAAITALTVTGSAAAPQAVDERRGYRAVLTDRPFLGLAGINSVFALSSLFLPLTLPTFVLVELHGAGWIAAALLVVNAVAVSLFGVVGVRWSAGLPPRRVLQLAGAAWAVGCAILAGVVGQSLGWAIAGLAISVLLFSVGEILQAPTSISLANSMASAAERGRYLAVFQYSFVVAEIVGPLLFAALFDIAAGLPFVALALLNVVAIVLLGVTTRTRPT